MPCRKKKSSVIVPCWCVRLVELWRKITPLLGFPLPWVEALLCRQSTLCVIFWKSRANIWFLSWLCSHFDVVPRLPPSSSVSVNFQWNANAVHGIIVAPLTMTPNSRLIWLCRIRFNLSVSFVNFVKRRQKWLMRNCGCFQQLFKPKIVAKGRGTVMVSTQKCSEQSKKTMREDESWLHLIVHSSKGVFSYFSWI